MNYILFDDNTWENLLPLTFTKPIAEIRVGILTIKEKWEKYLKTKCSYHTKDYLRNKFPTDIDNDNIFINGSLIPSAELISEITNLEQGQILYNDDVIYALRLNKMDAENFEVEKYSSKLNVKSISNCTKISNTWDIFRMNGEAIENDFKAITKGRKSQPLSKTNTVLGDNEIFIERGASIECAILNTTNGSIYIGKNAEIMEGSSIRGPFALGQESTIKMGAKIYGPTTIGPYCKAGGEINNSILFAYSNKGHDGFLGNSVIGEWCNLGADTNNSNLKNNYAEVKLWNYNKERFLKTGLQFCGLVMGDHSKCGINTMFNTGTVVGVSANIFGDGFPRNFVPSFAWGGASGFTETKLNKAFETIERVMERRDVPFDDVEKQLLTDVFNLTAKYRKQFN
jgi:UDP-N-acetylglucosamine diphosphorylase/glucosamine-1-phosphate N-acetyltransferase